MSADHPGIPVCLSVNGVPLTVHAQPGETLLETLRSHGHWDVREGCGEGACGACTVALDGVAVPSCLVLTATCDGRQVVTPAGVCHHPLGARLAQALVEGGAVQCGFCTGGVLVTAWCLLSSGHDLSPEVVRQELAGNLCRCGGSHLIVDAIASLLP